MYSRTQARMITTSGSEASGNSAEALATRTEELTAIVTCALRTVVRVPYALLQCSDALKFQLVLYRLLQGFHRAALTVPIALIFRLWKK